MIFICLAPQYKIVISRDVIKITDKYCVSCHPPRRGWDLWRFAALIPSGCRLTPIHKVRPLKKTLELKARENRIFEHDSTFFTFRLNNRFSESCFYR